MSDASRPLFSIGAVARMLELPPATIRTWEARYGLVVPQRSAGGQRLYSRRQVDQLRFVREEVARGNRPAQAHRLLAERVADEDGRAPELGVKVTLADLGRGDRALALVAPGAEEAAADAVLSLPVEVGELLAAARALAAR